MLRKLALASTGVLGLLLATNAQSQAFPNKPIRIIVGFAAGGNTDIVSRTIAERMQALLGQPVLVENRAGAGGVVATEFTAKSAPDGYTLLMSSLGPHTISPSLLKSVGFDPIADLAPVSNVAFNALLLMVNPSVPAKTVQELIAYEKSNPGKLNFGSSGVSGTTHLSGEVFNSMTGTKLVHVAFRGGPPAIAALLAGDVQLMFANLSDALPQIRSGKVRGIAVTSTQRVPQAPELPTIAESGLPGYDVGPWNGWSPRARRRRISSTACRKRCRPSPRNRPSGRRCSRSAPRRSATRPSSSAPRYATTWRAGRRSSRTPASRQSEYE